MRMNDANVYGVGAPKVLQENAYMLLYVRDSQRPYRTRAAKALAAARVSADEKELAKVCGPAWDVFKGICDEPWSSWLLQAGRAEALLLVCSSMRRAV